MGLPWVRMDTNTPAHDKILGLVHDPSPKRWQALASYYHSIMWSGGQGTDGHIPPYALGSVHGTQQTARLLVTYRLWEETTPHGWLIVNFAQRQELEVITEAKRHARQLSAEKANCSRWHGPDCWKPNRGCGRDL